ncbi:MAG TPA: hypothetical protein VN880_02805 [Solirubrobacteraceae bacterium]|nr:hypothetical protein [Solirubrobacteraceae bacterium]
MASELIEQEQPSAWWPDFSLVADTGLVTALPLTLFARPKGESDPRRH